MIKPTVGRVVWYWPNGEQPGLQPCSAQVAHVIDDRHININWLSPDGSNNNSTNVRLVQPEDVAPADDYCTWMPYQQGQAAKTEALEKQIASGSQDRAS